MSDLELFEFALLEADTRFLEEHTHYASGFRDHEVDLIVEDWFKPQGDFFELR